MGELYNNRGFILSDVLIGFVLCTITLVLVFGYFQVKSESELQISQKLEESEEKVRQAMEQQSNCQRCVKPTASPIVEATSSLNSY